MTVINKHLLVPKLAAFAVVPALIFAACRSTASPSPSATSSTAASATAISPGHFNAGGTVIAVYFLVTGITGLQLLGAENWVRNVFYGAALVLAASLSETVRSRRGTRGVAS